MATDPKSLSNLYQDQDDVAKHFARVIYNITINSKEFNVEDFGEYDLHLCEAFCLLWQNAETGEVNGRKLGLPLKISVFAAVFIDLYAAKRIEFYKASEFDEPGFRIINKDFINTFLDIAIFDSLRTANKHGKLRDAKLWKWLQLAEEKESVECTFDSLVARGILSEKKSGILGIFKRFPTLDPEPERNLEEKIKNIAFKRLKPDSYMMSLLVLSRDSDRIFMCKDPILRKHFTSSEYADAKKNLDRTLLEFLDIH